MVFDENKCMEDDNDTECVKDYDCGKSDDERGSKEEGRNNASPSRDRNSQRVLLHFEKSNANTVSSGRRRSQRRVSNYEFVNVPPLSSSSTRKLVKKYPPTKKFEVKVLKRNI